MINDNPDLSYGFVRKLLIVKAEVAIGRAEPFNFGEM